MINFHILSFSSLSTCFTAKLVQVYPLPNTAILCLTDLKLQLWYYAFVKLGMIS